MLRRYEYFLEKTVSISDDGWVETLNNYGSQGWELSSILLQDMKKELLAKENEKNERDRINIIFKREY